MIHRKTQTLTLLAVLALGAAACGLLREPEQASGEIEAIPLEVETQTPEPYPVEPVAGQGEAESPYPVEGDTEESPSGQATARVVYQISPGDSLVRFELNEELRGQPKTVVGTTDQVAGQIALNLANLSQTEVGVIQINARTLQTDNNFRNRAIQNEILDTGEFEFITFTPTAVEGLPAAANLGEEVSFTISGDLTIRDVTRPVVFEVTATATSETELSGSASTVVQRADYNLVIPQVRQVANVEEEVELYIDFVAVAG